MDRSPQAESTAGDTPTFLPLMGQLRVGRCVGRPRSRSDAVRRDKAYSSRALAPTCAPKDQYRYPRSRRPEGTPETTRITRRPTGHTRPCRPQEPQPDRPPIPRCEATARPAIRYENNHRHSAAALIQVSIAWIGQLPDAPYAAPQRVPAAWVSHDGKAKTIGLAFVLMSPSSADVSAARMPVLGIIASRSALHRHREA